MRFFVFIALMLSSACYAKQYQIAPEIIDLLNKDIGVKELNCKSYESLSLIRPINKYRKEKIKITSEKSLLGKTPFIDGGNLTCFVYERRDKTSGDRNLKVIIKESGNVDNKEYSIYHADFFSGASIFGNLDRWNFSCKKDNFTDEKSCKFSVMYHDVAFVFLKTKTGNVMAVGSDDANDEYAFIRFGESQPIKSNAGLYFDENDTKLIMDEIENNNKFMLRYTMKNGKNSDNEFHLTEFKEAKSLFYKVFDNF